MFGAVGQPGFVHLLVLFVAALLISSVLTRYVRNTALKHGFTCDTPRKRDVHASPIPRLGGVAITATFMIVAVSYVFYYRIYHGIRIGFGVYTTFAIMAPGALIFILGLYDDLKSVSPRVKFGVQIIAAMLLYYGGVRIHFFPLVAGYHQLNGAISLLLTILWVLLISNAFNLIDGLDGLSAGSALFSTLVVFVVSLFSGNSLIAVMTAILAGSILGFLRYNFNPATIFLGDSGSLFLGFMLSAVSLAGAQKGTTVVAVAIPIVSFGLPLLDTLLAVARRFLSGQPLFSADREHIHHKLLKRGFTHKQSVVLLYGVSALLGLLSLLMLYPSGSSMGIVLAVVGVGVWIGVQHLGYHEFAELGRAAQRTVEQKQVIVNNLAIRRATEELAGADEFGAVCAILQEAFEHNEFDGFDLSFRPRADEHEVIPQVMRRSFSGAYSYEWRKAHDPLVDSIHWQLGLALIGPSGQHATFTVYRRRSPRNLLIDINLLTKDFQDALGAAIERSLGTRLATGMLTRVASMPQPVKRIAASSPQ